MSSKILIKLRDQVTKNQLTYLMVVLDNDASQSDKSILKDGQ
jgi:hypothetical protein